MLSALVFAFTCAHGVFVAFVFLFVFHSNQVCDNLKAIWNSVEELSRFTLGPNVGSRE